MFDLFRSGEKAKKILLSVVLGVVALSMLLYLIPGAGAPLGGRTDDQTVAEIGSEVVTTKDIEAGIRSATRGGTVPPDVLNAIIPQIVESVIAERAMAYDANRLGFEVSDAELANTIRSTGQFANIPPQQYRQIVEQQFNVTVPEYEHNFRMGLLGQNIQNIAMEGAFVSEPDVEKEFRHRNEMIRLEYIAFDPVKLADQVKPTEQELKDYYEKNKVAFSAPETRSVQLIVADQVKVGESIQIPDSQVLGYYNSHKDQYRTKERLKVRHILIYTTNKTPDEIAKLKAKAEDVLKQIKAGADFGKMAEKYSDDKTNASKGGDLGWVMRGQMVPEAEKAAFALKPGQISDVIQVSYGLHILQVSEKEDAHLRPLDEVKAEILTALKSQTVFDRMQSLADQARAELAKAPQNGQQIAAKLGLLFAQVDKYKSGDTIPELGSDPQVAGTITSLAKGGVSPVMQSGEKLVIASVTNVNPAHPATFEEAEAQVRTRYAQERGSQLATEKANKAAEIAKANGGDLKAAAKAVGLEVKTTAPFNRTGAAEGIGDARYLSDGFDKPVGTVIGPINVGTQTVLAKILDRTAVDMGKLAAERTQIVTYLKGKQVRERSELVRDSVVSYLVQKGKVKIHQDVLNRLMDRYRST